MRNVIAVAEYELQRMLARFELDRRFRLTFAKVPVTRIARDRLVGMLESGIDQQIVVARVVIELTCRGHGHPADTEFDGNRRADG